MTPLLHSYASPQLDAVMWAITTLGSTLVVGPLFVIAEVALLRVKRRREALFLAIALIGSVIMNGLLKLVFQRPRPDLPWAKTPLDYSFPSGHTMNSLVFYLALALIAWVIWGPRVGIPATIGALILAVLIGISRIYLGAHYFSDVVAGFIAGPGLAAHRVGRVRRRDMGGPLAHWPGPRRTRRRSPRSDGPRPVRPASVRRLTVVSFSAGARSPSVRAAGPTP